jgi:peptidoglycan hydrolase-like protein with peptidoglycan-binding domain
LTLRTFLRILVLSAAIAPLVVAEPQGSTVAQTAAKKPAATKPATKTVPKAKAAPKSASSKTPSKKSASKTAPQPAAIRRTNQQHPTSDRYKEIQQALADKRYFSGSVDGNWGQDSVDALKRFQHDQNLTEDGKIGSLSLIALGLGPKHDASPTGSALVSDRPSEKTDP